MGRGREGFGGGRSRVCSAVESPGRSRRLVRPHGRSHHAGAADGVRRRHRSAKGDEKPSLFPHIAPSIPAQVTPLISSLSTVHFERTKAKCSGAMHLGGTVGGRHRPTRRAPVAVARHAARSGGHERDEAFTKGRPTTVEQLDHMLRDGRRLLASHAWDRDD